jgi:signal transduction histidine kinase
MNRLQYFINKYIISDEFPLDARIFNMVCCFGLMAASVATIARLIEQVPFITIAAMLIIIVSIIFILIYVLKTKRYAQMVNFVVISICDVLFPVVFFTNGGMDSGMPAYFVMSMFIAFVLLRGLTRKLVVLSNILIAIVCYIINLNWPALMGIVTLNEFQRIVDHIQSFLVTGLFAGFIFIFMQNLYEKEREKAQRSADEAIAASKAKSSFLSSMSHEMRTPMNAIIGMTQIGMSNLTLAGKDKAFARIDEASKHLLGVINDILDMSKIEAGKIELSSARFDFGKVIGLVSDLISFRVAEKDQVFNENIDGSIPQYLIGDDQRFSQVIANLLSNAVKFTPERGWITLTALNDGISDGMITVRIIVTDTGIGISEEEQSRLFKPFEQADSGTSRKFGGTGLGLSISKHIAEHMDGDITIVSEPGKGSTFTFTAAFEIAKQGRDETVAAHPAKGVHSDAGEQVGAAKTVTSAGSGDGQDGKDVLRGRRILVAEDIDVNREIVEALLEPYGLEIKTAENGIKAVEMISNDPNGYDLILMDMQMPEMDGLEATRRIRKMESDHAKKIPIIAMTANVFAEDVISCLDAGMQDHLGKPIDVVTLIEKIRKYII